MSMVTSSGNAHSIMHKKKGTQKVARTRMALYNQRGKGVKEKRGNRLR
jgi:hypothetical protein